ncbi:MAG TPA: hypothetical protein VGI71_07185 [Scandinavium sp.]|jgi:hypothetical protein
MAVSIGPVWVPVVSSAVGGIMAITGGIVTQLIIAGKEKRARERKVASERAYLGSQLLVSLMDFRDCCRDFADCPGWPGMMIPELPSILYLGTVNGDWSVLPGALLLRIRRLPMLQEKINPFLVHSFEIHGSGAEYVAIATERYRVLEGECTALITEPGALCRLPVEVHLSEQPQ